MLILVWFVAAAIVTVALRNFYLRCEIESLPSIAWLTLMIVPFLYQSSSFPVSYLPLQALGVSIVGLAIVAGDYWVANKVRNAKGNMANITVLGDARLYALIFFVFAAYHLSLLDHIPVVEKLFGLTQSERELQWMREETSKLLPVPDMMKYVFTWNVNVFAPLAILLAFFSRRYVWGIVVLVAAIGYSVMSLAKVPIFLLSAIVLVALLRGVATKVRRRILFAALLLTIPFAWHAGNFLLKSSLSVLNYRADDDLISRMPVSADDPRASLTIGDHARLRPRLEPGELGALEKVYNYFVYRLFLGPSDVSSRWYQFYPDRSGGFIGLDGLTPETRKIASEHPARRVGKWAYTERFPDRYLQTAQAYASVDADAYSRFGMPGIIIIAILVLGIRLSFASLLTDAPASQAMYSVALVLFSLLWPMASIQAVLIPNGLLLVLAMMVAVKFVWLIRRKPLPVERS